MRQMAHPRRKGRVQAPGGEQARTGASEEMKISEYKFWQELARARSDGKLEAYEFVLRRMFPVKRDE